MAADEIIRSVREARQRVMQRWVGLTDEEIIREVNESGRRMMEEIEQQRQAATGPSAEQRP